jgi:hypothetical protein
VTLDVKTGKMKSDLSHIGNLATCHKAAMSQNLSTIDGGISTGDRIMARTKKDDQKKTNNGANVGYEAELWQMADALRGSMDAAIAADLRELGYGE